MALLVAAAAVTKTDGRTICIRIEGVDLSSAQGLGFLEELYTRLTSHPDYHDWGSDADLVRVYHYSKQLQPNRVAKMVRAAARAFGIRMMTSVVA